MPQVVDPLFGQWRREALDLIALAHAELLFTESECEEISYRASELAAGTMQGDRIVAEMRASVSFIGRALTACEGASVAAQAICIERYINDGDNDLPDDGDWQ